MISWIASTISSIIYPNEGPNGFRPCFGQKELGKRGPVLCSHAVEVLGDADKGNKEIVIVTPAAIEIFDSKSGERLEIIVVDSTKFGSFTAATSHLQDCLALGTQVGAVLCFAVKTRELFRELRPQRVMCPSAPAISCVLSQSDGIIFAGATCSLSAWVGDSHIGDAILKTEASALCSVGNEIWCGQRSGEVTVFSNALIEVSRLPVKGKGEGVQALSCSPAYGVVFCLSAHTTVTVWDSREKTLLNRYPTNMMTCGVPLSAMGCVEVSSEEEGEKTSSTFLLLGGTDGSFCARRLGRRKSDGRFQCFLLRQWDSLGAEVLSESAHSQREREHLGDNFLSDFQCPVTCVNIPDSQDLALIGTAGCQVIALHPLVEWLSPSAQADIEITREGPHFIEPVAVGRPVRDASRSSQALDERGGDQEHTPSSLHPPPVVGPAVSGVEVSSEYVQPVRGDVV